MYSIEAKEKPKWYNFRWKLSNMFVSIARRIKPNNPEVTAFFMEQLTDQMIYGHSITRVEPDKYFRYDLTEEKK